jgi:hypothetical protein
VPMLPSDVVRLLTACVTGVRSGNVVGQPQSGALGVCAPAFDTAPTLVAPATSSTAVTLRMSPPLIVGQRVGGGHTTAVQGVVNGCNRLPKSPSFAGNYACRHG